MVLLEVPRWAPAAFAVLSASFFALLLSLFFLIVWLAFAAGSMVTAQEEIRRSINKQGIKIDRLYSNDRVRRDREERKHEDPDSGPQAPPR